MKAINVLLAASVITAGAANAAPVATFNGSITASILYPTTDDSNSSNITFVQLVTSSSGAATAVLDDSGTFTITANLTLSTVVGSDNTLRLLESLTGTWDGTTFTATGGTHTYVSCVDNPNALVPACSIFALGVASPADVAGSLTLGVGTFSITQIDPPSNAVISYNYSFPSSVPVPATAWLFGSGLLGVAAAARRKTNQTKFIF